MPDYTLDSDWRQPVIEWNGTPLTKEEVYKRIISGVTDPKWWERWVYHGGGILIRRRHTKKLLASMIVVLIDDVRVLVQKILPEHGTVT